MCMSARATRNTQQTHGKQRAVLVQRKGGGGGGEGGGGGGGAISESWLSSPPSGGERPCRGSRKRSSEAYLASVCSS